jgi:hypothetical protein
MASYLKEIIMFKIGDRVRVNENYPAYDGLAFRVGRICSMKPSMSGPLGRMAIKIDFDGGPRGKNGLVFYEYELDKVE